MIWKEEYNIGSSKIDGQHKSLCKAIDRLVDIVGEEDWERNRRACIEAIKFLKEYTLYHFQDEEEYMMSIGYVNYAQHKSQHDDFRLTVRQMEEELTETNFSRASVKWFLGTLVSWLLYHILNSDQAITGKIESGVLDFGNSVETAIEHLISQLMREMYHIEAVVVDKDYQGSLSEDGIFCLLDWRHPEQPEIRSLMALDERLAIKMASTVLDIPILEKDELVVSAVQELANVLMVHFASRFQGENGLYRGENSRIVTFQEYEEIFEGISATYSLLFHSPQGDFVLRFWRN